MHRSAESPKRAVNLITCSLMCAGTLILLDINQANTWFFCLLFGLGYGGVTVTTKLVLAELFGLRSLGKLLGIMTGADAIFGGGGNLLSGRLFDATGSFCGYRGVGREIVLVDVNRARAEAEANDIHHAVPFAHPLTVRAGGYAELRGCRAVVIAAGVAQRPGETRLDLLQKNAAVFRDIIPRLVAVNPGGLILIATNPVDILTHISAELAGLPPGRVLGSGTILDTARLRFLLGEHYGVDPRSVHASVVGEPWPE